MKVIEKNHDGENIAYNLLTYKVKIKTMSINMCCALLDSLFLRRIRIKNF